jgi:hypothetical protein
MKVGMETVFLHLVYYSIPYELDTSYIAKHGSNSLEFVTWFVWEDSSEVIWRVQFGAQNSQHCRFVTNCCSDYKMSDYWFISSLSELPGCYVILGPSLYDALCQTILH